MRAFTPDVREALAWFERTCEVRSDGLSGARWELVAMPNAGGAGDQPAWVMEAIRVLRTVRTQVLTEQAKREAETAKAAAPAAPSTDEDDDG